MRGRARGTVSWPPPWIRHGNERSLPKATSWVHAGGKTETAALSTHIVFDEEVVTVSRTVDRLVCGVLESQEAEIIVGSSRSHP